MKKTFILEIETEELDFVEVDLKEVIEDGMQNVGNYTIKELTIEEVTE